MNGIGYIRLRRIEEKNGLEKTNDLFQRDFITLYRGIANESLNINPLKFAPCWASEKREVAEKYAYRWAKMKNIKPILLIATVRPKAIYEGVIRKGILKICRYDPEMVENLQIIELK